MFGPILRGEKISLEPPLLEDAALRVRWFSDLELSHFWTRPDVPSVPQEQESYERWARDDASVHWRIALGGGTIGFAYLRDINWLCRQAEQGTVIGERAAWGKGF